MESITMRTADNATRGDGPRTTASNKSGCLKMQAAPPAESMILSAPPAESVILSAHAESIILSAGGAKQQSTKSCNGKFGKDGGGRCDSGGSDGFDIGSGDNNCSDDSNGNSNVDGDSGDGDSGNNNPAECIMLSAQHTLRVSYSQCHL
jgi:hypothetical protein